MEVNKSGLSAAGGPAVLFVEDDEGLVQSLIPYLRASGYHTEHEPRGDAAIGRILSTQPDVVLLDMTLPGCDGVEVCKAVRDAYHGVIIALTKRAGDLDHILVLERGADDFLAKPVQPAVLLAHVKAALRRRSEGAGQRKGSTLEFGILTIDLLSRSVSLGGKPVSLTSAEFDLLWVLAVRAGDVVSRSEIRSELRGANDGAIERSFDTHISHLRKALDDDVERPRRIKTVRGRGYLFNPQGWD